MANVIWEVWVTAFSPATCITCRGLHGKLFRQGEGPQPQLHVNCRCQRRYHYTERGPSEGPGGNPPLTPVPGQGPLAPVPAPPRPTAPLPPLPPLLPPLIPIWPGDDEVEEYE